jgi:hypothetical protein
MVKVGTILSGYNRFGNEKYIVASVNDYSKKALLLLIDKPRWGQQSHLVIELDNIKHRCFEIDDTWEAHMCEWVECFITEAQEKRQEKYEKYMENL